MAELIEEHWKRGVQDRVYFRSSDGVQVGWLDLKTGREVLIDATHRAAFDVSVDRWARGHHNVRPGTQVTARVPTSVGGPSLPEQPYPFGSSSLPVDAVPTQRTC